MDCLTDCDVWVPMNLNISKEDTKQLKNSKAGDVMSLKDDLRMRPDWLIINDNLFFPIFSNVEEATEEYSRNFSLININMEHVINFTEAKDKATVIILDAFTKPVVLEEDLMLATLSIIKMKGENEDN